MTHPTKTLEKAKKEFENKWRRGDENFFDDESDYPNGDQIWYYFESIFSSLTQQMIPEEKDANKEALNVKTLSLTAMQAASEALKFHGYNQAISEMKQKRKELLNEK